MARELRFVSRQYLVNDLIERIRDYTGGACAFERRDQRAFDLIVDDYLYRNEVRVGQRRNRRTLFGRQYLQYRIEAVLPYVHLQAYLASCLDCRIEQDGNVLQFLAFELILPGLVIRKESCCGSYNGVDYPQVISFQ